MDKIKYLIKSIFKKHLSTAIYVLLFSLIAIVTHVFLKYTFGYSHFDYLKDDNFKIQMSVTIASVVVTLLVTLEICIKQIFSRSKAISYFSHTGRTFISISIFLILFVGTSLNLSFEFQVHMFLYELLFVIITFGFFMYDLIHLNISGFVKKELKKSCKKYQKRQRS